MLAHQNYTTVLLLLNKCPFIVVAIIMTIITMTTANKGQFLNNKTVTITTITTITTIIITKQ